MSTYPLGGANNSLRSSLNDVFALDTHFYKIHGTCLKNDAKLRIVATNTITYFENKRAVTKDFNDVTVTLETNKTESAINVIKDQVKVQE